MDGNVEIDDRRSVISIASQIGISSGLENENIDEKTQLEQDLAKVKLYEAMTSVLNALKSKKGIGRDGLN